MIRGTLCATLDDLGRDISLEVDIDYDFSPGEKMVRYYRDGSGDPGCPPSVELIDVTVTALHSRGETRRRGNHWIWNVLDQLALGLVNDRWTDVYESRCIEEAECERDFPGEWDE